MTRKSILTIAAVSVLAGGLVVATTAFAQTSNSQNAVPSLVSEIASKFNLNKSDVQGVFDQHRKEVMAKQETNYENYLANLVSQGKITEEQKQLILNKHNELITQMQNNKSNFKNLTPAQRMQQMQATRQDLQNWAKQNNIDIKYLHPFGFARGFGRRGMHMPMSPTPTP